MNKHIILLLLFIFILYNFVFSEPPKCITNDDSGEDASWYIYEFSKEKGYIYWNSEGDSIETSEKPLRLSENSPLLKTFFQRERENFNYVTYNNQPAGPNIVKLKSKYIAPQGGHTKGFFIWNDDGGVHVMHSIPDFPQYKTNDDAKIGLRKIEWHKQQTDIFRQGMRKDISGKIEGKIEFPGNQQAQYAYCYPLSKNDIENVFVYRHLVMTNSIIGVANDMELRNSLSYFQKSPIENIIFNPFPKIYYGKIPVNKDIEFYKAEDLNPEKISDLIKNDIGKANGRFPINILSSHAYNFIVYSKQQHYSWIPLERFHQRIYFYQRDNYFPQDIKINSVKIKKVAEHKNVIITNIWMYASSYRTEEGNPLLGPIYLQTQHYDHPDKGYVPVLNDFIYQVENVKFDEKILTRETDHSKQAYSVANYNDNNNHWFCVGDNNFIDKQSKRGGSVTCFISPTLSNYFSSKVQSYKYRDKEDKVVEVIGFDIIRQHVIRLLIKELSNLKNEPLLNQILLSVESELWVKGVDNNDMLPFSLNHIKIVNDKVVFPHMKSFCLPSFFYRKRISKTILYDKNDPTKGPFESAKFFCIDKESFKFLMLLNAHDNLQITDAFLDFQINEKDLKPFWDDVLISFLLDKINELLFGNKEYVYVQKKKQLAEQPSHYDSSLCQTSPEYRILYGTCIDIYFFCLKMNFDNIDMNQFYNTIGKFVVQGDLPGNYILPKELEHIQCLKNLNNDQKTHKRKAEPNTSDGGPQKKKKTTGGQ